MLLIGMEMMGCQNLAVPAQVMQSIVQVESGSNPFAIGVVGAQLERQPQNLGEALATVHMLETMGYNFSLGLAQINRANLSRYGIDSYEKAFDICPNLMAGSRILADCYASAGGDWGKTFSCYYSGNFRTGYDDGYVNKVYNAYNQVTGAGVTPSVSVTAVPLQPAQAGAGGVPAASASAASFVPGVGNPADQTAAVRASLPTVTVTPADQTPDSSAPSATTAHAATDPAFINMDAAAAPTAPSTSATDADFIVSSVPAAASVAVAPNPNAANPAPNPNAPNPAAAVDADSAAANTLPMTAQQAALARQMQGPAAAASAAAGGEDATTNRDNTQTTTVFEPQVTGPNDASPAAQATSKASATQGGDNAGFVF